MQGKATDSQWICLFSLHRNSYITLGFPLHYKIRFKDKPKYILTLILTTKNVSKMPFIPMQISCDQFLPWWLLSHVLNETRDLRNYSVQITTKDFRDQVSLTTFKKIKKLLTSGGRQSSACLRRTEKPPWVLVSEAVSVLQNEWTVHLGGSGRGSSGLVTSLC